MSKQCEKGIWTRNNQNTNVTIIPAAERQDYRDLYFVGSFCPPEDGIYRLIFEGSIEEATENELSFYSFNFIKLKNRTTPYHSLYSKTCYPYWIFQSIHYQYNNWGKLYFQKMNEEKQILTFEFSYSCERLLCQKDSKHPTCFQSLTCKQTIYFNTQILFISLFIFIQQS